MPHTKLYMRSKFLAYQSLTTQLLYTCMTTDHMTTDSNIFWLRHCSVMAAFLPCTCCPISICCDCQCMSNASHRYTSYA